MASVTGFTAARMLGIENNSVVDGSVVGDDLILTRHGGGTINAGNVRGPIGSPGVTELQLADQLQLTFPTGSIVDYIGAAAPNGWLTMTGQRIVGGQTLHPDLWEVLPASMKDIPTGDILMPDTRGRVSVGLNSADTAFDTIGETGGAKTHQLTVPEMAQHNHTGPAHVHTGDDHSHDMSHDHTNPGVPLYTNGAGVAHTHDFSANSVTGGGHSHYYSPNVGSEPRYLKRTIGSGPNALSVTAGSDLLEWVVDVGNFYEDHSHGVSGSTGQPTSTDHQHVFDVPVYSGDTGQRKITGVQTGNTGSSGTGDTGNKGDNVAHNNLQPYIVFLKIIKAV